MNSKTKWIFYEKWWFWAIFFILIIRACSIPDRQSPKKKVKLEQESKIDVIQILGTNAHFFIKDSDETYARLYSEWPRNITLSSDSTFNINCHLKTCGDYDLNGTWGEPTKIDYYNDKQFPYDIRKNADWLSKGELIKVPMVINPVAKKRCETNTFSGFRESKLPNQLYGFLIIYYSKEDKTYIPYLFSSFLMLDDDYSGKGKIMVSIYDMSK